MFFTIKDLYFKLFYLLYLIMKALTFFVCLGSIILAWCTISHPKEENIATPPEQITQLSTNDTLLFKSTYEALNNTKPYMLVPEQLNIHILDFSGVQEFLESGSGILYFWFPSCPWCRNLLPNLFEVMKENQILDLYVFDPKEIRDEKVLGTGGELIIKKATSPEYQYLLNKLNHLLPIYEGLNDPQIKRLYVPLLVVIKNGEIVWSHFNTLEEQEDPNITLTNDQKNKLKQLLNQAISPILSQSCWINNPAC